MKNKILNQPVNAEVGCYVVVTDCITDSSTEYLTFHKGIKGGSFQQWYLSNYSDALNVFEEKMKKEVEMFKVNCKKEKVTIQIVSVSKYADDTLEYKCFQSVTIQNF